MTYVLLTGAGFSRNWGGWLASVAFEYLIGCPELDLDLRTLLWNWKRNGGGFEDALAELQNEYARSANAGTKSRIDLLQSALVGMFNQMNNAFAQTTFEQTNDLHFMIRTFLVRFDAIFTLNQDLLLERHYLDDNLALSSARKWAMPGWQMPGLRLLNPSPHYFDPNLTKTAIRTPDPSSFQEKGGLQPYYKLHGSANWHSHSGERMLVMGGNKAVNIGQHPLLRWYSQKFTEYLSRPQACLMVIGYSFSDGHIKQAIINAAEKGGLKLFIVDPAGVDVLDKELPHAPMRVPGPLMSSLNPHIMGASRRSLSSIFGNDRVEFSKVTRFFET
jgi:SIR2-like domain